ncbi:hypothetical protein Y032_0549g3290 [Ancylostoma ceylanicum]|uniref:Uncharacterized protein n=1 Tax=Ancylostoma ceylanicum TaxID=53326 RepID=A0A016WQM7_9BILA|nr:hypothetical protein Y032_0549g3290 [Ancylostoma ceylanicum]
MHPRKHVQSAEKQFYLSTLSTRLIPRKYSTTPGFFETFGMFTRKFSVGAAFDCLFPFNIVFCCGLLKKCRFFFKGIPAITGR